MHFSVLIASALAALQACRAEIVESFHDLPSTHFDFIIIGGGTAGNVVANRLTENPKTKVLVLEAGGSPDGDLNTIVPLFCLRATPNTSIDWNYTTVPQAGYNNRAVHYPRGRVLGGSSSVNFLAYTRGTADDWDRYARVSGDYGWSWDHMQKYFLRNERWVEPADHHATTGQFDPTVHGFTGVNSVSLAGFHTPLEDRFITAANQSQPNSKYAFQLDHNSGQQLGISYAQSTIKDGERSSSATSYLAPQYANRKNLYVLLHAQVSRVLNSNKKKNSRPSFDTVEFTDGVGGPWHRMQAKKEIILSAGSVDSPHILLNSGIGDSGVLEKVGVEAVHHLPSVGRNLSDHPIVSNFWLVNAKDTDTFDLMLRNETVGKETFELWQTNRTGPLVNTVFNNVAFVRVPPDADVFKKFPDQDPSPGPNTAHIELVPMPGHLFSPYPDTGHYVTISAGLLQPTARGTISLRSNNPFDAPLIDPNYLSNDFDVALMREGIKIAREVLTLPAFDGYIISPLTNSTTDDEIDEYVRDSALTFFHPVATCAMSPQNAKYGVVDPDLRLKGADGIRVVDASVLPFTPAGHTQAPVYAVAERASDIIKCHWMI
ncbi:hypothetical protein AGABI2DRAFT_185801 [Agaricus bisporus var. bisporus H97]|uniref:hypothetical protein n=1 Tax=Agaricus bisporus var. bisporus (strain H97 / ATCC MYA-4626 / FGSC 10389) TaxID=936046 RepID=UPI00029F6E88|nr:hypothetical protein AGABI2DRAFT_185801 [Agaricus bisporus var. bisporus H97]EKV46360.1 hypothetical protein AGABI2DRAFT_185801 [Agaricus bisporus var. bisporus H97]